MGIHMETPNKKDWVIEPYFYCRAWQNDVEDETETMRVPELFRDGEIFQNTVANVNKKLGFTQKLDTGKSPNLATTSTPRLDAT